MANNSEKSALRKLLLEKRDATSFEFINISSKSIHKKLKKISEFNNAKKIGCYYPIGSEVRTQDIMLEAINEGKEVFLPKVVGKNLSFRKILGLESLQKGSFDIMEPKDDCPEAENLDIVLVPTVGISSSGIRLGYGHGYYDRFLASNKITSIALTFQKQLIKSIPSFEHDIRMDWVVTEDNCFKTSNKI